MGKPFWQSKTLWVNAAVAIGAVFWPEVQKVLTPEQAGLLVAVVNFGLRLITTQPVTGATK